MDKIKNRKQNLKILVSIMFITVIFVILFYSIKEKENIFVGFFKILTSPAILVTDFIEVGGIGAAFLNAFLIFSFNLFLIKILKIKINGAVLACLSTVFGFSFFGKNMLNILPFYLGGILYSSYSHTDLKDNIITIMFSSALAPFVSAVAFNAQYAHYDTSYISAVSLGVIIGFIVVPLSKRMYNFHNGFDLYNIGFTAGILGAVILSILKMYHLNFYQQNLISFKYDIALKIICIVSFLAMFVVGFFINDNSLSGYKKLLLDEGYKVDFTQKYGYGLSLINMSFNGLLGIIFIIISQQDFNGPVLAGLFTLVGFSASGKTPFNSVLILIGVYIASIGTNVSSFTLSISGLFGTALAPIAGVYGIVPGILAGWLHLSVVQSIGIVHGGLNLYNNGFSAGIVAAFIVPIIDMIIHKKNKNKILIQKKHAAFLRKTEIKLKENRENK